MDSPNSLFEKRLAGTVLTKKPQGLSLLVASGTCLFVGSFTMAYWQDFLGIGKYLEASRNLIFVQGEYWRIFTAILIHQDLGHYLSNMLLFFVFGHFICGHFGFSTFPVLAFAGGAVSNALSLLTYPLHVKLLGASGMVFYLGSFWLVLYLLIQRQYSFLQRLTRVLGVALMLFFPTTFAPEVSYRTHAIGFAVGVVFALIYFYSHKKLIRANDTYKVEFVEDLN